MGHRFSIGLPRLARLAFAVSFVLLACVFSLIAVGIGCGFGSFDRFINLFTMDRDFSWGCDSEANLVASNVNHHHSDIVANDDFFVLEPTEYKHCSTPLKNVKTPDWPSWRSGANRAESFR
jgi:hypothetical protein